MGPPCRLVALWWMCYTYMFVVVIMMHTQYSTVYGVIHGFIRHGNIRLLVECVIAKWFWWTFATYGSTMYWLNGLVVIDVNPWRNPGSTKVWVIDPSLFDVNMTHYCLVMVYKKYIWMNSKVFPLWWNPSREDALRIELS